MFQFSRERTYYQLKMFFCLFLSLIFIEAVFKQLIFKNIFVIEFIRIILFSATISAILSFIGSFVQVKIAKIMILVFIFTMSIYTIGQLAFNNFLGNYMSLNAAGEGGLTRVKQQIIPFIFAIKPSYYICLLPFIILLIMFILNKPFLKKEEFNKLRVVFGFLVILCLHLLSILTLSLNFFQDSNQIKTNKQLYKNPNLIELSLKQFGTVRFLYLDIVYMIKPHDEIADLNFNNELDIDNELDTDTNNDDKSDFNDYNRTIDDTAWLELVSNTSDSIIKNLHQYYMAQSITPKNEYTGKFKDKNLILIMVEAFDQIAINEQLTPTLYKLKTEGMYFDNYYTPKYSCTTGESEFIGLTSIIPSNTVCTPNTYKNNIYKTSIFNLFNNSDYFSTSYHNWRDEYYERRILHKSMGSSAYYNYDDLGLKVSKGWPSDYDLFVKAIPYFLDKERFFTFITTVSTHFYYDTESDVVSKHWNKVKDLPYSTKLKSYLAKAIDLDLGLEHLLNELKRTNKLNDTVIVLFGDHHPLNMGMDNLNVLSSFDRTIDFNDDKLPFIIYNSEESPTVISKTASTFDILPTLANLFDLEYDPRYYMGKDIFSDEETIVIFANGSWITDKAIYFSSTSKYKELDGKLDDNYIKNINKKVNDKFYVSNQTLIKDYFKYR